MGYMAMDGLVPRPALAGVMDVMVKSGELDHPVDLDDVLKDQPSIDAYNQLVSRGLIDPKVVAQWRGERA